MSEGRQQLAGGAVIAPRCCGDCEIPLGRVKVVSVEAALPLPAASSQYRLRSRRKQLKVASSSTAACSGAIR